MEPTGQDYSPARPQRQSNAKRYIIVIVILLVVGAGGYFFIKSTGSAPEDAISPTPFQFPTEVPTPVATQSATPKPGDSENEPTGKPSPTRGKVASATDLNIQILNGSGEVGVAGQVRDYLKSKGYQYFETGNADNFEYENTSVSIKSSLESYGETLIEDLSENYTLASDSASLPNDSLFDAVVTVGK